MRTEALGAARAPGRRLVRMSGAAARAEVELRRGGGEETGGGEAGGEEEGGRARALGAVRAADMAHSGRLLVPLAALALLLWAVPGAHGRRSNVRVLTDENWTSLLEGEWMIEL